MVSGWAEAWTMGSRKSNGLVRFILGEKSFVQTKLTNSFKLTRVVVNSATGLRTKIRGPRTRASGH